MALSNLPGPWRWEERRGLWWRVHQTQHIEDGPHTWSELNLDDALPGPPPGFRSMWYDRTGKPVPMLVANDLLTDYDYKVVAKDVFVMDDQPVEVSTVWLGLDHNHLGRLHPDLPYLPKIFETMIFGGDLDLEQWRYSTEEEALAGHAETVKLVQVICEAKRE
jgi:hypothetical protein